MAKQKFVLSLVAVALGFGASAMADDYGMAGCGLGSMIIKKNSFEQIFVGTTNATSGSQTFGISTGTSNCKDSKKTTANLFYEINKEALKRDVARGEGETIVSLAEILGCDNSITLASNLQKNFAQVFGAANSSKAFMDSVEPVIQSSKDLHCAI